MGITIRPPENVYRKPHELVSSVSYLSAALGTVFLPVPPAAVALSAPVLLALSALRTKQGLRIRRIFKKKHYLHNKRPLQNPPKSPKFPSRHLGDFS